jgi:hypothetical protein
MNKRQVILLWVIAIALAAAVTAVKFGRVKDTKSATARTVGQTLLPSFDASAVATIEIQGAADAATLVKKDGKWAIAQRGDYPAKTAAVNELLRTVADLKIAQAMQAGPSFAPRFGMDDASKNPKDHGITTTFKDAAGKELAKITVGKAVESASAAASPMGGGSSGRFVRNHADESGFYAVSELFAALSDQPKKWLSDDFLKAEKIKSITVTQPGKSDPAWKVLRATEDGEFALEGGATGETIDPATASAFKSLLAFTRVEDIVPAADVDKRAVANEMRTATIVTFEGITYTIKFTPTVPGSTPPPADPEDPSAPADEAYLATVEVAAELPTERKKPEGEKPEDAKAADEAFAERSKVLTEKVAKEKALAGHTFQIGKFTFESLLKDRAGLIKPPTPPAAQPGGMPMRMPMQMPGHGPVSATSQPVEATTEPIAVPATEAPPAEDAPPAK